MAEKQSREGNQIVDAGWDERYDLHYVEYEDGSRATAITADGILTARVDLSESIKQLKAIQREARKATADMKEVESLTKSKYLVIELDELGSIPRVTYKGEEIGPKAKVGFNWDTANARYPSRTNICIDYFDEDVGGSPVRKDIHELKGARRGDNS